MVNCSKKARSKTPPQINRVSSTYENHGRIHRTFIDLLKSHTLEENTASVQLKIQHTLDMCSFRAWSLLLKSVCNIFSPKKTIMHEFESSSWGLSTPKRHLEHTSHHIQSFTPLEQTLRIHIILNAENLKLSYSQLGKIYATLACERANLGATAPVLPVVSYHSPTKTTNHQPSQKCSEQRWQEITTLKAE